MEVLITGEERQCSAEVVITGVQPQHSTEDDQQVTEEVIGSKENIQDV